MDMEKIQFTDSEVQSIADEIDNLFAIQAQDLSQAQIQQLNKIILNYIDKTNILQQELEQFSNELINQKNKETIQDHIIDNNIEDNSSTQKDYGNTTSQLYLDNKQQVIMQKAISVFSQGYILVTRIREHITNQSIIYHVAVEGKNESIIYELSEENLINSIQLDTYRFMKALQAGNTNVLSFVTRYASSKKKAEENGNKLLQGALPNAGSTLWSHGYRVFETAKSYLGSSAPNFGHFLEAYYFFGGNKKNRNVRSFDSVKFYQYMEALKNSTPFYKGGDFKDIQLKSNTATLTNLQTIIKVLIEIQAILNNDRMNKRKNIKALLTEKGLTKRELKAKVGEYDVPEDLLNALSQLDNKKIGVEV